MIRSSDTEWSADSSRERQLQFDKAILFLAQLKELGAIANHPAGTLQTSFL